MKNKKINKSASRRDFLKKAALSSSAMLKLPMMGSSLLWANSAFAASAPKRVIFVYTPGGAVSDLWIPKDDFVLPTMSAPLEPVKQHCLFLKGVNMAGPGHGLTSKALIVNGNSTLDVYLAQTLGDATPFAHLQLGVLTNGFDTISRYNWNQPTFEDSPINAFERLFGAGAAVSEDIVTRQKRSVLDASLEAFNQMRSKLGSFEQSRLDEHANAIRRIEKRLSATTSSAEGGVCTTPTFNSDGFSGAIADAANFDTLADLQSDVITLALKCDLTRIVSFMLGNDASDFIIPESGIDTNYHSSIHGRPLEDYAKFRAYFTKKLTYLVQKLAATEDVDGKSLLDNTIILTVADMADARAHSGDDVPYTLIGGANFGLKGGRVLDLGGASYGDVLDTIAHTMGLNDSNSDYRLQGNGPISGIFS